MKYVPITANIKDVLDGDLEALINKALIDMAADMMNVYKSAKDPRKITIELSLVKFNDENMAVDFKVTPKAAPYTQVPEKQEKVAPGQVTIDEIIDDEVVEKEQPQIEGGEPLQIEHNSDPEEEDPEE